MAKFAYFRPPFSHPKSKSYISLISHVLPPWGQSGINLTTIYTNIIYIYTTIIQWKCIQPHWSPLPAVLWQGWPLGNWKHPLMLSERDFLVIKENPDFFCSWSVLKQFLNHQQGSSKCLLFASVILKRWPVEKYAKCDFQLSFISLLQNTQHLLQVNCFLRYNITNTVFMTEKLDEQKWTHSIWSDNLWSLLLQTP